MECFPTIHLKWRWRATVDERVLHRGIRWQEMRSPWAFTTGVPPTAFCFSPKP